MAASINTLQTFKSADNALAFLQKKYGSAIYSEQQVKRKQFYSYVSYPLAGANVLNFFGTSESQSSAQFTNVPQPSNFGNVSFLLNAVYLDFFVLAPTLPTTYTADNDSLYSDLVHGFAQAGSLKIEIGASVFARYPRPFLYAPPASGRPRTEVAGFTLTEGAPNTVTGWPASADLNRLANGARTWKNPVLIEPQQNFSVALEFPSGAVPVIGTDVVTVNNPLYVGCVLDGTVFIPVQ